MPNSLQVFLTAAPHKAAADLVTALLRLPEEKRDWSPAETARTAIDRVAECAILNGKTASLIRTRIWPESDDFADFLHAKT